MKTVLLSCLAACSALASAVAGTMSVAAVAPVVDGGDIAQLVGTTDIGGNQGHAWSNRPRQGQSFTTGTNPGGYILTAITQRVRVDQASTNSPNWELRVGTLDVAEVFVEEVFEDIAGVTINQSNAGNDYPAWVTWTLEVPLLLTPNTVYAYDVYASGGGYISLGDPGDVLAGGFAYSCGSSGSTAYPDSPPNAVTNHGSDRVFHVDLALNSLDDADGDGLPTQWEIDNNLDDNDDGTVNPDNGAAGDPDMDGSDNANEFAKGTDPHDDDSDDDTLLDGVETGTGTFLDAMNTGSNPLVADTDGDTLDDGDEVSGVQNVNFGMAATDPTDADSDNDNLSDGEETSAGADGFITDPNNADTDGDAVNDDVDGDPLVADPDPDGDGIESADEISGALNPFGDPTDPNNPDTDGDGISDGDELDAATGETIITNPAAADTDGDGLDDDAEFAGGTDPTNADTDGDGFGDGVELANGSDPIDPNSQPAISLMSVSTVEPVVDGEDIASLAGLIDIGGNQGHAWNNRPRQGQSFTTGPSAGLLRAITVRVKVDQASTLSPTWELRVGSLDGAEIFTPLLTANIDGVSIPNSGAGNNFEVWVTWSLGTPLSLDPNSAYAFDVYPSAGGYISLGESADVLPGGSAYSAGSPASAVYPESPPNPITTHGNDRNFHLDIESGGPGRRLIDVESIDLPGGPGIRLTWDSRLGRIYTIESSTDLENWSFEVADQLLSAGEVTTFEELIANLPQNGPEVYFRVREFVPPPLFSDDFESGLGGWTTGVDGVAATQWELGAPINVGPLFANSGTNCFGTNIASDYADDANAWLRSPTINLTNAQNANLSWFQWVDVDTFDSGAVRIFDASNDTELGVIASDINFLLNTWTRNSEAIPAAALGKTVYLEFRFLSDDDNVFFPGWYIDDVEVTVP